MTNVSEKVFCVFTSAPENALAALSVLFERGHVIHAFGKSIIFAAVCHLLRAPVTLLETSTVLLLMFQGRTSTIYESKEFKGKRFFIW